MFTLVRRAFLALSNRLRRRHRHLDYILLNLPAALPALPAPRSWLRRRLQGTPPLSLLDLDKIFVQIGADPRPKGVVLLLSGLSMSLADLQTLRESIRRLRATGKRVIAYGQGYGFGQYYVASGCDEILLQPGGDLSTIGLRQQTVFLKDALDRVGVSLDVVAISPFKGAYDSLSRASISPEAQQQFDWILDSRFDMLLQGIADGRGWTVDRARDMVDTSPHLDTAALEAGYVDAVLNQEGLSTHLQTAHLVTWGRAKRMLFRQIGPSSRKKVLILPVVGTMVAGESAKPPGGIPLPVPFLGTERVGDRTVVRQVRSIMKRKNVAAVVLFVDSPGGVAIAAEAMTSALEQLSKDRPVVVYMNGVAASGGYYIATAGRWIMAQPGTLTGSIGVVSAKPVAGSLLDRFQVHAHEFTRGANAGLYSEQHPFTDAQRAQVRASIEHIYRQFLGRVARSRSITQDKVDEVGGGRVWTGAQAQSLGLLDELGDLHAALRKARQLADLPDDTPFVIYEGKGPPLPPQLAPADQPAVLLAYLHDSLRHIANLTPQLLLPVDWR